MSKYIPTGFGLYKIANVNQQSQIPVEQSGGNPMSAAATGTMLGAAGVGGGLGLTAAVNTNKLFKARPDSLHRYVAQNYFNIDTHKMASRPNKLSSKLSSWALRNPKTAVIGAALGTMGLGGAAIGGIAGRGVGAVIDRRRANNNAGNV